MLGPILAHQNEPGNLIALFVVQIQSKGASRDATRRALDVVSMILQQCLRADTAVLIPDIGPVDEHKRFFVVANMQQRGAEVMENRILSQLGSHQEFHSENFPISVSHIFLPPMSREGNESMEEFAERAAVVVRNQINNAGCLQGAA